MKKLIAFMGAVIMAVSFCIIPCSANSSTSPSYSITAQIDCVNPVRGYTYLNSYVIEDTSSSLVSSSYLTGTFANKNTAIDGQMATPTLITCSFDTPTNTVGSILLQGTFTWNGLNEDLYEVRGYENGTATLAVVYSDGTGDTVDLVYGTDFYITTTSVGGVTGKTITFYASIDNIDKTKELAQFGLGMQSVDTSNSQYFGIYRSWDTIPDYLVFDYTNFMITFGEGSGGGGSTDPDDPDNPGTGGDTGGDSTTSKEVLDAIITLDQTMKYESTAIQGAIESLGDRLAHVDTMTAVKLMENETKRQQLEEDLSKVEDIQNEYFNDLVNRFQLLGLEDWDWPVPIIEAFALLGGIFTRIWDTFGAYKVVYLFPMVLSIILVLLGRIARYSRRTGSGATNNADRAGEVKDA